MCQSVTYTFTLTHTYSIHSHAHKHTPLQLGDMADSCGGVHGHLPQEADQGSIGDYGSRPSHEWVTGHAGQVRAKGTLTCSLFFFS